MSLKAKTAKDLICKEPEIKRIESTAFGLQFPTEDRAEKIRDFHEIKGQYGGFFYSYLRFLRLKTAQLQNPIQFKPFVTTNKLRASTVKFHLRDRLNNNCHTFSY